MMTGGKEILTYARKKPPLLIAYKRKRLLPRKDCYRGDECASLDSALTTEEKKEESTEGYKSEHPKKDFCTEHAPEEAEDKSLSVEQKGCLQSAEQENEQNRNENTHDMEFAAESIAVLDGTSANNISQKASEDQQSPDPPELQESNSVQEISCSFLNSSSASDEKSTVTASCSTLVDPDNSSLKTSYTSECTESCATEKFSLKETGLSVEDKSYSFCMTAAKKRKLSSPLKTFQRRSKPKKDIDCLHVQSTLDINCEGTLVSARFASIEQGTHVERGSEHASIASKNVEPSYAGDRSSSESGSFRQPDHKMENILREGISTIEGHPQITEVNVGLDSVEGHSGNSPNNATVNPALEPALFNNDSSIGKESQILSSDGLNRDKGTHETPCAGGSTKSLDLSIPANVTDGGIASVCDENSLENSLDAPSRNPTTHLNDESPGIKGLELLHENIGETTSSQLLRVLENGCTPTPEEAISCKYNVLANSSPADTLNNSYLQLFPERSAYDTSCSTKMHHKGTSTSGSEERIGYPMENQAGTAEANSSLFLGLFMPMEAINSRQNGSFPSSHWTNGGGVQSREFLHGAVPQGFPVMPADSMRHKMMLDDIVNRTRTPQQNRSFGPHLYGYPTTWSDEELDCLWMGVRRYGRGNWEVMLKDPRLAFSPWRTPWDLAQQWEEEQAKLLSSMASSQGRHQISIGLQASMDGFRRPTARKQNLVEDVQLSLGDVYSEPKNSSVRRRSLPNNMDIQNNGPMQHQQTDTRRTSSSYRRNRMRATLLPNLTQDVDSSVRANYSADMPTGKDFPQWLKELAGRPFMLPQAAVLSDTSAVGPVGIPVLSDTSAVGPVGIPHADKGIDHELGNQINNKNTVLGSRELQIGAGAQSDVFPAVKDNKKNKQEQHSPNKGDLIVIDSDASSEETISDNRGAVV